MRYRLFLIRSYATVLSLAVTVILTRLQDPKQLGKWLLVLSGGYTLSAVVGLGLPIWTAREASAWRATKIDCFWSVIVSAMCGISVFALALGLLLGTLFWTSVHHDWLRIGVIIVVVGGVTAIAGLLYEVLRATDRPETGILAETIPSVLMVPLFIVAQVTLHPAWSVSQVSMVFFVCTLASAVYCAFTVRRYYRVETSRGKGVYQSVLGLVHRSWPIGLNDLLLRIGAYLDLWVAGVVLAPREIALYGIATRCAGIMTMFQNSSRGILQSKIPFAIATANSGSLKEVTQTTAKFNFLFALGMTVLFLVFGQTAIALLFGSTYSQAWFITSVLLVGKLAGTFLGPNQLLLNLMSGSQRVIPKLTAVGIVLQLLLMLVLSKFFGVYGIAFSASVFLIQQNVAAAILVYRRTGFWSFGWIGGLITRA